MSSNLRFIRIRDFMKFTPKGPLDFAEMIKGIHEFSSAVGAFSDYNLLIDTRGTESHLSASDLWRLAKELAESVHAGASKGFRAKISALCPVEHFDHATFFELCAQNRGLNVRAFTSFEDVFDWLGESSTPNAAP